jgi:uncharacterized protein YndB with AHSA1/START domain
VITVRQRHMGKNAQMATIRVERQIDAPAEDVWDALRDWGAIHQRLVPGFVTDARLDGDDRIVTFFNGAVVREVVIDSDDEQRRLVWSVVDGPYTHHNGVAQVFAEGEGSRFVWTADLLPNEAAAPTGEMMEQGIEVLKKTQEAAASGHPLPADR